MWASGELLEQWRVNSNIRNSNLGVLSSVRGQEGPIRVETSEKLHFIIAVRAQAPEFPYHAASLLRLVPPSPGAACGGLDVRF
ncbi:hypothetical protein RRG08_040752 [Elysia crispata]|uniref:Uncharacterized protein n=1 Tax=Elysia crispata TaxID=231223 RepID=A0AAE1BDS3_9GAST|nr:hypothetical protein RRG08_040752 [Elysia crispata]